MAARTESKAKAAIDEITRQSPEANIDFIQLDLNSFDSISAAAKTFEERSKRLDILLNNAGVMNEPYRLTKDGYESQLGTNHLGTALLTKLLLPTLLRTAEESDSDVRIVNLSSTAYNFAYFSRGVVTDTEASKKLTPNTRYGSSKLANLLHARALSERYPQITATSVHPGIIDTGLFDHTYATLDKIPVLGAVWKGFLKTIMQTVETGARNQLWAATAPKQKVRRGYFFEPVGKQSKGGLYGTKDRADKLWDWSEGEFRKHGF